MVYLDFGFPAHDMIACCGSVIGIRNDYLCLLGKRSIHREWQMLSFRPPEVENQWFDEEFGWCDRQIMVVSRHRAALSEDSCVWFSLIPRITVRLFTREKIGLSSSVPSARTPRHNPFDESWSIISIVGFCRQSSRFTLDDLSYRRPPEP
jgi:hypothetical protein